MANENVPNPNEIGNIELTNLKSTGATPVKTKTRSAIKIIIPLVLVAAAVFAFLVYWVNKRGDQTPSPNQTTANKKFDAAAQARALLSNNSVVKFPQISGMGLIEAKAVPQEMGIFVLDGASQVIYHKIDYEQKQTGFDAIYLAVDMKVGDAWRKVMGKAGGNKLRPTDGSHTELAGLLEYGQYRSFVKTRITFLQKGKDTEVTVQTLVKSAD